MASTRVSIGDVDSASGSRTERIAIGFTGDILPDRPGCRHWEPYRRLYLGPVRDARPLQLELFSVCGHAA